MAEPSRAELARAHAALRELGSAVDSDERGLAINQAVHGAHHPAVIATLCSLATVQHDLGMAAIARGTLNWAQPDTLRAADALARMRIG